MRSLLSPIAVNRNIRRDESIVYDGESITYDGEEVREGINSTTQEVRRNRIVNHPKRVNLNINASETVVYDAEDVVFEGEAIVEAVFSKPRVKIVNWHIDLTVAASTQGAITDEAADAITDGTSDPITDGT